MNLDPAARQEMLRRSVTGVPAFLIGDDLVVGFDRERILALVDHRLATCSRCGAKLRVPTGKGRLKVTCRNCGNTFEYDPR